jgi:hypothetical protein
VFKKLWHVLRLWHQELQAKVANRLVRKEIVRVLSVTHAQELAEAPRAEWALIKRRQAEEIQAVIDGNQMDIIDRRTWAYPYLPEALHRLNQPIIKNTPYNLRRFSETPIPRRAINLVKNGLLQKEWEVTQSVETDELTPDVQQRIQIATESLKRPNNQESFREFAEAVLEDLIIGGYGTIEPRMTPYYKRPFKLWAVDGSTIRIFMDYTESTPDRPKFAQMTGLKGERGIVTFLSREIIYIRDNVRTSTPFGLGKLEVAFNTVNAFLAAQDMASRAGADQIHKTFLWWEQALNAVHIQTVRRYIINEQEGQAKISMVQGAKKPEVVDIKAVTPEDLLLDWQKFLIDIIANAFDLSPMALGQTDKVNKATGQVMADSDFRSSVLPMAKRFEEALTYHLLHGFLGWNDLKFRFIGLEDPDAITRGVIQQRNYMMNAMTPDEIRKANGLPPLPGGWGRLTMYQMQILMAEVAAQLGAQKITGAASSGMMRQPSLGTSASGTGLGGSMSFQADQVAQMNPDEIQMYQMLGLLPPTQQLGQQMEQQQPGILLTLSDELKQFFEQEEAEDQESQIQPAPITTADENLQQQKFELAEHQETLAEKMINRRGMFGPSVNQQYRQSAERGKYPRSGGKYPAGNTPYEPGKAPGETVQQLTPSQVVKKTRMVPANSVVKKKNTMPKNHYRAGVGNPYR